VVTFTRGDRTCTRNVLPLLFLRRVVLAARERERDAVRALLFFAALADFNADTSICAWCRICTAEVPEMDKYPAGEKMSQSLPNGPGPVPDMRVRECRPIRPPLVRNRQPDAEEGK
jgi:hypothetical protein